MPNIDPQRIDPREFKDSPCPCGHNEFGIDQFAAFKVHRFRADMKATMILQRFTCRRCGCVRDGAVPCPHGESGKQLLAN